MVSSAPPKKILFLTGHLAAPQLRQVLAKFFASEEFRYEIHDIGVQVAGLMTSELIARRLPTELVAQFAPDEIMVPGRCRGDLAVLAQKFGRNFRRGPDDLHDLPQFFALGAEPLDLSRHHCRIFAEITNAPGLDVAAILARAAAMRADGADVIDLGGLPDTEFPHLEESVQALLAAGFTVSVDSANPGELRRGAAAGCHYILSLTEKNLDLAFDYAAIPVIIPTGDSDPESLYRAVEILQKAGKKFIADPLLQPIPFGLARSIAAYKDCRDRLPDARILMGIGNVTELLDADSTGVNAMLFGMIAELGITEVLTVQDSPHCRRAIAESDRARRVMAACLAAQRLPMNVDEGLMGLRSRTPIALAPGDIAAVAAQIRDDNFRIEVSSDGIHLFNRDLHVVGQSAEEIYPHLAETLAAKGDVGHGFYLGSELARAEIALSLGKRYVQDEALNWGVAATKKDRSSLAHGDKIVTKAAKAKK
ncbi:MAG: DUF6513 domain-containing protein [Candidatus Symbiobacter sp.]|nr:DUF6513 domain-containing protein [Candidatus Symbiobacter sp.]